MAVYKRYKGKYLKPNDPNWDKGTWVVQFVLRGHNVKEAIPEARTRKQAEQVETQIRQARHHSNSHRGVQERALRKTDSKYKRTFASSTINSYLQVLSRVLSMAFENGIIDSDPMERVNRLREPEPRERFLNQYAEDEEERLINALVAYGEHMLALVELDLEVGMRLGELLNATWGNVVGDVIFVMQTKNDKPRAIPLTSGRSKFFMAYVRMHQPANVHPYDIADLLGHSVSVARRALRVSHGDTRMES